MQIYEVTTSQDKEAFISMPNKIYDDNPYYIKPLIKDIKSVFDKSKNPIAKPDSFKLWLLKDSSNQIIGRIAAFINPKTVNKNNDYPVGGIGFFECIDSQQAADLLFDTTRQWLSSKGMEAMEGPINFGERDKFWGLLTDGFDEEPNYLANYNPEYYKKLFETYGFQCYFNQFSFKRAIEIPLSENYMDKANEILNNPEFEFKHIKIKELNKFSEDFRTIYNKAWAKHLGVSEMTSLKAKTIINSLKQVLDEKAAWFGYHNGQPIAFFVMIPEVNQVFKHVNGKLNLRAKSFSCIIN
ncbi:MAG: hypothetical protein R2771_11200 [Saprospiraceae bacterium]